MSWLSDIVVQYIELHVCLEGSRNVCTTLVYDDLTVYQACKNKRNWLVALNDKSM